MKQGDRTQQGASAPPGTEGLRAEATPRLGAPALSDAALLSALTGVPLGDASSLVGGGLRALCMEDPDALFDDDRLGPEGAARLLCALELSRRALCERERRPRLRTPGAVAAWVRPSMALLPREHVRVLCFNSRHVLLRDAWVGLGAADSCAVDPREVYLPALRARAYGVVLVHNHPSGDPEPSVGDVAATRQLLAAGKALGIRLLDHLVIGAEGFVSLAARGLLPDDGRSALVTVQSALTKPEPR